MECELPRGTGMVLALPFLIGVFALGYVLERSFKRHILQFVGIPLGIALICVSVWFAMEILGRCEAGTITVIYLILVGAVFAWA